MTAKYLDDATIAKLNAGHCPDCDHRGFVFGPSAASSTNIECGNVDCLARFNVGRFSASHRIIMAHRIPKRSEGGADNWGYGAVADDWH